MPQSPDSASAAVVHKVWYETLQPKLGSTQLTHAVAQVDAWVKQEARFKDSVSRWHELLSKGHRETVEREMATFLRLG